MLGAKIYKAKFNAEEYASMAKWCNENNATIEDKGDYYECVTLPEPTLDELKQDKINELKSTRDTLEVEPLLNFDVDSKSLERIDVANKNLQAGAIQSIKWTMADNTVQEVTAEDFSNLYIALATRSNMLHEAYRVAKGKVEQATTADEVSAITLQ